MRALAHIKPLDDLTQTARPYLPTLGAGGGSASPQIEAAFWAAVSHWLGGALQLGRERAAGAAFRRIETESAPSPDVFGTFPPVIPFWFRAYRVLDLFSKWCCAHAS
jgi:hypothetical protein